MAHGAGLAADRGASEPDALFGSARRPRSPSLRRFCLHMIMPCVLHRSPRRVLLVLFVLVRFVIVIVVIAYVFLRSPVLSCMLVCSYVLFYFVFASSVVHIYYSSQCPFCR